ncbi:MAG: hypothetical protein LBV61_08855 [Burkholderiaceae bacterium]|jgi:hypothetical protein|nr:hypothetical protein [Burkholderiaceae bacterium]
MRAINAVWLLIGFTVWHSAAAEERFFTGTFQGEGRQCQGELSVRAKSLDWRTPFATCKNSSYKIIKKISPSEKQEFVFVLNKHCDFGVVSLEWNPEYPDYWNVTGYRTLNDFMSKSDDKLQCGMKKQGGL